MGASGNLGVLPSGANRIKREETVNEYINRTTKKPSPAEVALLKTLTFVPTTSIDFTKTASGDDKMTRQQYDTFIKKNWTAMCKDLKKNIGL